MIAAAYLWYLLIFTPDGGLVTTPVPYASDEDCEAAIVEFRTTTQDASLDFRCMGPDEEGAP